MKGKESLDACLNNSVAKIHARENKRLTSWDVRRYTVGRYVRIQLDGVNVLHFAQVEVFGHENRSYGPVSSCAAGKFVTAAVVDGIDDDIGIETAYKRAISSDW